MLESVVGVLAVSVFTGDVLAGVALAL